MCIYFFYYCFKSCIKDNFTLIKDNQNSSFCLKYTLFLNHAKFVRLCYHKVVLILKTSRLFIGNNSHVRNTDPTCIYKVLISKYWDHNCSIFKMCSLAAILKFLLFLSENSPDRCHFSKDGSILVKIDTLLDFQRFVFDW